MLASNVGFLCKWGKLRKVKQDIRPNTYITLFNSVVYRRYDSLDFKAFQVELIQHLKIITVIGLLYITIANLRLDL